ncbi:MAG: replicative DNA helicase [Planctomycetes bacterium]|nr:replicative DNA helicase [Planctomycetota bacterium]
MTTITTSSSTSTTAPPNAARVERVPPQNLDAEMALVGSMMMSRDAIAEVIPIIGRSESRWFYLPVHQKLFEILVDLYDDPGKAIDLIVVSDELRRRDLYEFVGGQDYMIQLAESFAEWANAEYYARIVRDCGMLRDLIRCASEISDHAYANLDDPKDILDRAEQKIFETTEQRVSGTAVEIRDVIARLAQHLRDGVAHEGLDTGFRNFDDMTGGLRGGDLVILAGRPSMGKTALGLTIARNIALDQHKPVGFFSMEMSNEQVGERLICAEAGVDLSRLRKLKLSDQDHRNLQDAAHRFEKSRLLLDDTAGMTVMELRSKARRMKQRYDIQVVFVDYLQLMHQPRAESRQVEIATISRGLKGLARELKIPVVALSQLNRMAEGRADKKPLMSDLRESGAIEQDADLVLLIHREEYYHRDDDSVKGLADLIIAKQRNGPTGDVVLSFESKLARFSNYSAEVESYRPAGDAAPF